MLEGFIQVPSPKGFLNNLIVRRDMDIKWWWDTIQLYAYLHIKVKEQCFYCCSTFHSHCRVFNNEHNSYRTLKWVWNSTKPAVEQWSLLLLIRTIHLDIFIVLMLFDVLNFISKMLDYQPENKNRKSRKQNMGEVILQILSSSWVLVHPVSRCTW